MKIPCGKLSLALIIQLSGVSFVMAQNKPGTLLPPPQNMVIDAEIKKWGDSLRYFNTEKQVNYSLANDKDNLYMAIKIADRSEQLRILKAGITFSINPEGKKKETYSITFPVNTQAEITTVPGLINNDLGPVTEEQRGQLEQQKLTTLRGIKVEGFKDIEGDMITTSNTYGVKTAINYDDAGDLVCEAAIPISFFHANNSAKNEWAFNFKINGIKRPALKTGDGDQANQGGGGRGGRGGGGGFGGGGGGRGGHGGKGGAGNHTNTEGGDPDNLSKSADFWEKFYLAK